MKFVEARGACAGRAFTFSSPSARTVFTTQLVIAEGQTSALMRRIEDRGQGIDDNRLLLARKYYSR